MDTRDKLCSEIAERQFGLIERAQALRAKMSPSAIARRLATGRWQLELPRVYRFAGTPRSWEQSLKAATLWGGEGCIVSHQSAATLHGLGSLRTREVHVQLAKQLRHPQVVTHRTRWAGLYETSIKGIPTASLSRALIDLAGTIPGKTLEKALDEAIRLGLTDLGRVKSVLRRSGPKRQGAKVLRALLEARDPRDERSDSELEDSLIRLLRSERLPPPEVHYNVMDEERWLGEVDLAYPRQRIAIQAHGYRFHSSRKTWEDDQRLENALVEAGWKVLKVTHSQLENDPSSIIGAVRALLGKKFSRSRRPRRLSTGDGRSPA
jgi:very-short-patch-repair endonuclease